MIQKKKLLILGLLICAVAGFTSATMLTTVPIRILGPFYTTPVAFDSATIGQVGCQVQYYLSAANDSPRIGHIVTISAKNTVKHSATLADYNSLAGVVVGGTRTSMQASYVVADTGTLVATTGQRVIVCTHGRAWVLADTTLAGIAPGAQVIPSVKAGMGGRMTIKPAALDSLNRVFGRLVDTALFGKAALVQINVR